VITTVGDNQEVMLYKFEFSIGFTAEKVAHEKNAKDTDNSLVTVCILTG
jgi:hypothetical protein